MNRSIILTASLLAVAACTDTMSTNENGAGLNYDYDTVQERYGALSEVELNRIDADADGEITENELQAAGYPV